MSATLKVPFVVIKIQKIDLFLGEESIKNSTFHTEKQQVTIW